MKSPTVPPQSPPRRPALGRALSMLIAAAWLSGIDAAVASPPTATIEPATFTAADGTAVAAERGALSVPMRRGSDSEATVELAFIRFPSTAEKPGAPIVYLAGGPGGSGIDAARGSRFPLFQTLRAVADVIAFDQRGTGDSTPSLRCTEEIQLPFDRPATREAVEKAWAAAAARCAERLAAEGIDLDGYTTAESAADLEELRRALGAEKISLWGISYGTHLALATMRAYPDSIERVILAGVEPLHHTLKLPSDQQELLEEIARRAAGDPAVAAGVPDLLGSIRRLLERLEREPATVQLTHPVHGVTLPVAVGALDLQATLAGMLRGPESFALLPDLVARLGEGDWTALALTAARLRMGTPGSGMSLAMDCASGASAEWLERIAREAPGTLLGDAINLPAPGVCEGVPVADLGDDFRAPMRSEIPALLISGTLDGRTPPANAHEVLPGLTAAHHLVLDGAGHSDPLFLSSPKILDAMLAFLRGEPVPWTEIAVEVPGFVAPRTVAALAPERLGRYAGVYEIAPGEVRRALAAGDVLYTIRGEGGAPFPLRPLSPTRFFYEGSATWVEFELDADGGPVAMVVHHDGAAEGERAVKVE